MKWREVLALTRAVGSIRTALLVFIVLYAKLKDVTSAFSYSLPIALICFCIFILNDINDLEVDKINHPNRPLPAGAVSVKAAVIVYYVLLAICLLSIRLLVDVKWQWLYFILLVIGINYVYIVINFPYLKNIYVASTATYMYISVGLIASLPDIYYLLAVTVFLYVFSLEMISDLSEMDGDGQTFVKFFRPHIALNLSFLIQYMSTIPILIYSIKFDSYLICCLVVTSTVAGHILYNINKLLSKRVLYMSVGFVLLYFI